MKILLLNWALIKEMYNYIAVSYTHLDVYKRQGFRLYALKFMASRLSACWNCGTTAGRFPIFSNSSRILGISRCCIIFNALIIIVDPVSYTHLDVYKRQVLNGIASVFDMIVRLFVWY